MGIKCFGIMFDNPVKTYAPGDRVTGRIILNLDSPKKCRGLKIKMKGEAATYWRMPTGHGITVVRGNEEYFSSKYYLVGGESEEVTFEPGEKIFPFEQVLPSKLPSSYETNLQNGNIKGHIRYTVEAVIDRPWKFDHEIIAAFTVLSPYDLNTDPEASKPIMMRESKTFGAFSQTPAFNITMSLPVKGYVPGQSIPIKVDVDNQSGVEIDEVVLKLEKYMKYFVRPVSIKDMDDMHNMTLRDVTIQNMTILEFRQGKIGKDVSSFDHSFVIPPIPPSKLGNCNIIMIEYILQLKVSFDKICSRNLEISTPILIGTVPLMNHQLSVASSDDPKNPSESSSGDNSYPPPTFEKSILKADDLHEADDSDYATVTGTKQRFAPRYAYFYKFPLPH